MKLINYMHFYCTIVHYNYPKYFVGILFMQ